MNVFLFGVRSPIVVEYEETLRRLGCEIIAGISVGGPSRMLAKDKIVRLSDLEITGNDAVFYPCAFNPRRRSELAAQAISIGLRPAGALIDPSAVVAASTRLGSMTFVNAGAVIGGASFLGMRVMINRAANIGHHCFIADDVSIAPGVTMAGNIKIGAGSIIGVGATILPDVKIGVRSVVAGGSVVRHDIPDDSFVAGNPAVERAFDISRSSLGNTGQE